MNKNFFLSLIILFIFGFAAYFVIKNAPEGKRLNINQINMESNLNTGNGDNFELENSPQLIILKEGEGEDVSAPGDALSVFYTGYLSNGEVFDSNIDSEEFQFTIGAGEVIPGWDIGLIDMKVGEVRRLVLPPSFAYGSMQVGSIPANSTLIFDVELKAINKN